MIRPVVVYSPSDTVEMITRFEYAKTSGDGPAAQSHMSGTGTTGAVASFGRNSFDFSIDEKGFQDTETKFLASEVNWDVDFGEGTITNIFGWRDFSQSNNGDIDAQPAHFFHAPAWLEAEQFSNELRYIGTFNERTTVTAGLFFFTNDLSYHERRVLLSGALTQDGGGMALGCSPRAVSPLMVASWAADRAAIDSDVFTFDVHLSACRRFPQLICIS